METSPDQSKISLDAASRLCMGLLDQNRSLSRQLSAEMRAQGETAEILYQAWARNLERFSKSVAAQNNMLHGKARELSESIGKANSATTLHDDWAEYSRDASQRMILFADALRKRGDMFVEHEQSGCPPVLDYEYEVIMDGRDMKYPVNYQLLSIIPPAGITADPKQRPYIIIDPRAGHGPGIGGFKQDSQVGVALRAGHPVYFVAFRREPEPGQYLSFITRAEAEFVREVMRRHPEARLPVVIGNCQGGWATLLLAASNADLTGPIVVNGAPVSPWSGRVGENPLRYNGGVFGGTWIPMLLSDLGGGVFDGAHLVQNFELLNPGRTLFRKYADLFRDIDHAEATFLEFEKWWGGYFLLNENEIRWIVEQLFVGDRLSKNEARIEPGRQVDLKTIKAPIIVFASHGDNITPPQQALNWIADTYADVSEIRIRGQRIVYMVHDQVGHLGIFVSAKIANREHTQVSSTLETIESMAPGLYEMLIHDVEDEGGHRVFTVSFAERTLDDIRSLDDGYIDERPFAAVARLSEYQAQAYDSLMRPFFKTAVSPAMGEVTRALHPQRMSRTLVSSINPVSRMVGPVAEQVRADRTPARDDNPFIAAESLLIDATETIIDRFRDIRDMAYEMGFHMMWGTAWARAFGHTHEARRTLKDPQELRRLPEVVAALRNMKSGGLPEAIVRILVLLASARGEVRRDRLERSNEVLTSNEPFASLTAEVRASMIHRQALIVTFEPDEALETIGALLPNEADRELAIGVVQYIAGPVEDMAAGTLELIRRIRSALGLDPEPVNVPANPLAVPTPKDGPTENAAPVRRSRRTNRGALK